MSILDDIQRQFTSIDSPLMKFANGIQTAVHHTAAITDPNIATQGAQAAPSVSGPRPTAPQISAVDLKVPGDVDHARAEREAKKTLDSIDFSRQNIVLWMPATGSHSIPRDWQKGVDAAFGDTASSALVNYPANENFNDSVSTGQETLRLVLQGIAERGGDHSVHVAGHSQGAWVAGDTLANPVLNRMVDSAMLYGHPSTARVDWSKTNDAKVRQLDDPEDPFTKPGTGLRQALDGIAAIKRDGDWSQVGKIAAATLVNPALGAYLIGRTVFKKDWSGNSDPHHYNTRYAQGARFLAGSESGAAATKTAIV